MGTLSLKYALPISYVQIDGTVSVTTDAVTGETEETPSVVVTLDVGAAGRDQTLKVSTGWIRDTSVGVELTDDGRLVSSDAESTGQLGKVVLGVVGAGAAVAGVMMNPAALAGAATGRALREATTADARQRIVKAPPVDPAIAKYRERHAALDDLRRKYEGVVEKAARRIGELGALIVDEPDATKRWGYIAELRQLESVKPSLEAELDRLGAHFGAWRASQITTRSEAHKRSFTLDVLRAAGVKVEDGRVEFGEKASPPVRAAWRDLGVTVTMRPVGETPTPVTAKENQIVVRFPRRVMISVWEKGPDGKAVLRERKPYLVMDGACPLETLELRKSAWARRSVNLKFSELGTISSYKHAVASGAASAADTLGALPATVAGSLENAVKIQTQLEALRTGDLTQQLDRTKKQVELKQKEIEMAGLKATEKDAAELERLKQQADIAEKRKSVGGGESADKELAALLAEKELLDARRAASVAKRKEAAEADLAALRLEIERLEAQARADKAKNPPKADPDPGPDPDPDSE